MFLTFRHLSSAQTLVRRSVFSYNAAPLTRLTSFHSSTTCTDEPGSEPAAAKPTKPTKTTKASKAKKEAPEILSPERLHAIMQRLVASPPPQSVEAERSDLIREIDSHRIASYPQGISTEKYNKLTEVLNRCYTVALMREYLKAKGIAPKKLKSAMMRQIINECWGVMSKEQVEKQLKNLKALQVREQVPASREELFFVIGNNGATLRNIENRSKATITIDVSKLQYILEGLPEEVKIAKEEIKACLPIVKKEYNIPQLRDDMAKTDFGVQSKNILSDISKVSNTYIHMNNGKFHIAALSLDALDNSKRQLELALTEMGYTDKKPLGVSDHTIVSLPDNSTDPTGKSEDPYIFIPTHDTLAMPLLTRKIGWSRIAQKTSEEHNWPSGSKHHQPLLRVISNKSTSEPVTIELSGVADLLRETLKVPDESKENISVEALFGHLLLKNPVSDQTRTNVLTPPLKSSFGFNTLQSMINERYYQNRTFFTTNPPGNFMAPLIPVGINGGFHQRIIQAHYVNTSLLTTLTPNDGGNGLERLTIEFAEQKDGSIKLNRVLGEHGRAVVDALCVSGKIDIRILAKRYTLYTNENMPVPEGYANLPLPKTVEEMIKNCSLTGYSELSCPSFWSHADISGSNMALVDVSFRNESRHLIEGTLVTVSHTERQEGRANFCELKATHLAGTAGEDEFLPVKNGLEHWDVMSSTLNHLARRWEY
ncbi:hypothetical protein CLU79DRAFT_778036 [Phycomyces nitens]|nr:hypothetical protein CLU79DRAFT_778036 [Phycomyces nitens]